MLPEILDLVNENDVVIGTIEREEAYSRGLVHQIRVVDAFIKNAEGKLFIPRRQAHKKLFPKALDTSVGGHVISGDSYEETFKKEALEELNLDITSVPYRLLGHMSPFKDGVAAFIGVYEMQSDSTPDYNSDDFSEHFWLTPKEIRDRVLNGDLAKGNLLKILDRFYS